VTETLRLVAASGRAYAELFAQARELLQGELARLIELRASGAASRPEDQRLVADAVLAVCSLAKAESERRGIDREVVGEKTRQEAIKELEDALALYRDESISDAMLQHVTSGNTRSSQPGSGRAKR
jgi:hypothetical protein